MQFPLKKTQVNSLESTALCSMEIDLQYGLREKEKKEEKKISDHALTKCSIVI